MEHIQNKVNKFEGNMTTVKYYFSDDEYIHWFECNKCKCNRIVYKSNYCPNCGIQLDWNISVIPKDVIDSINIK